MALWVNRTVGEGTTGSTTATYTFAAASAGNFLVAVVAGGVTSATPTGWTLLVSSVNNDGLYVFTKTASAAESSFTSVHNGTGAFTTIFAVYEYPAGTVVVGTAGGSINDPGNAGPTVSGLTGTYTRWAAAAMPVSGTGTLISTIWATPGTSDLDQLHASATGAYLTLAYDDAQTGASFTASRTTTTNTSSAGETVDWALQVAASNPAPNGNQPPVAYAPMWRGWRLAR